MTRTLSRRSPVRVVNVSGGQREQVVLPAERRGQDQQCSRGDEGLDRADGYRLHRPGDGFDDDVAGGSDDGAGQGGEGAREVRVLGRFFPVRAEIDQLHCFSGHADRDDLLAWLTTLRKPPRRVFVVHGEEESAKRFAAFVGEGTGWPISVPDYGAEVILD